MRIFRVTNENKFCLVLEDWLVERLQPNVKNIVIWKSMQLKPVK